jgi:hypothetical protein
VETTDEDLLGYFEIHSRTERALFCKEDVKRLLELSGRSTQNTEHWPSFMSVRANIADPLIAQARRRMKFRVIDRGAKVTDLDELERCTELARTLRRAALDLHKSARTCTGFILIPEVDYERFMKVLIETGGTR